MFYVLESDRNVESGQCVPVETTKYVTRVAGPALTTHGPGAISQDIPFP